MREWLYSDLPQHARRAVEAFVDAYRTRYFELCSIDPHEVAAWQPIIAAVRFSVPPPRPSSSAPLLRMIESV